MCGITGFLDARADTSEDTLIAHGRAMAEAIRHRGPDGFGEWSDPAAGIVLAHRRLAIIDVSPAGAQPMHSSSGRWVIAFNGEIYNFEILRRQLDAIEPRRWRGHSDTEVMLAVIEAHGVVEACRRFEGMFAFAAWDRDTRSLWLARDRAGEKPLYYGWHRERFLFGSELKALRAAPESQHRVDMGAATAMLRFGYVPAPASILRGIAKLMPGTVLCLGPQDVAARAVPKPVAYWTLAETIARGAADPFTGSDAEAIDALEALLRDAIGRQMVSDVPLGAFLSGGVDSSTIVALMQAQSPRPVRTFAIGFSEAAYDEAPHARRVAEHLGTSHTELYATPQDAMDVIPRIPTLYDEPFADSSQLPTVLVAALARRSVTVSLSGDAGDELFGGYQRYFIGQRMWAGIAKVPRPVRRGAAGLMAAISPDAWDRVLTPLHPVLPRVLRRRDLGMKMVKVAGALDAASFEHFYTGLVSQETAPGRLTHAAEGSSILDQRERWPVGLTGIPWMMALDFLSYLPDDILVKVDRAAMGASLETRVPFLDPRVIAFAWSLPLHLRVRGEIGKWLLRQVLHRHVPPSITDRPKQGFGVPIDRWLRGPLAPWASALLDPARVRQHGLLDPTVLANEWAIHESGSADRHLVLWPALMLEAWLDEAKLST
jgi:asparagine synthase (glutamine-hydrolysing)